MLAGMALFGIAGTSNLLARYAAADVAPEAERGRAMGLIVWGSTIGSVAGPNLMGPALGVGARLGVPPAASAFLVSVAGYALAALLVELFLRPDPLAIARRSQAPAFPGESAGRARRLGAILGDLRVQIALAALAVSQFVMIGTTSTSPVYLHDQGHPVPTIGLAVSAHLAGMYVASPLSGFLCDRLGRLPIIAAGGLVLIGAVMLTGLVLGNDHALIIARALHEWRGLEPRLRGRERPPDRCPVAGRTRSPLQGLADLVHGADGRGRVRGGRHDPGRLGVRGPERGGRDTRARAPRPRAAPPARPHLALRASALPPGDRTPGRGAPWTDRDARAKPDPHPLPLPGT